MSTRTVYYGTSAEGSSFARQQGDASTDEVMMGTAFSAGSWICARPPGRCCAKRRPTVWERLKAFVLGPVRGFDLEDEPRCWKYAGHETANAQWPIADPHEDKTGRRWA